MAFGRQPLFVPAATHVGHVLVDRHQQVLSADVLIPDAHRAARAERSLHLDARLPRVGVLQISSIVVKSTSVVVSIRAGRMFGNAGAPSCVGNDSRDARLMQIVEIGGVPGGEDRVGDRAQGHAIEEQSGAAADDEIVRRRRRPGEADARRQVVRIGVDRLQELQVIAKPEVQRQLDAEPPFVLRVDADVGVGLRHDRVAERLCEAAVVAGEKVRE